MAGEFYNSLINPRTCRGPPSGSGASPALAESPNVSPGPGSEFPVLTHHPRRRRTSAGHYPPSNGFPGCAGGCHSSSESPGVSEAGRPPTRLPVSRGEQLIASYPRPAGASRPHTSVLALQARSPLLAHQGAQVRMRRNAVPGVPPPAVCPTKQITCLSNNPGCVLDDIASSRGAPPLSRPNC